MKRIIRIAVAVVIDHGGSGGNASYIARDIFEEYFFGNAAQEQAQAEPKNTLLP